MLHFILHFLSSLYTIETWKIAMSSVENMLGELKKLSNTTEKLHQIENTQKQYIALRNQADIKNERLQRAVRELDDANLKILELTRALEISKTKNSYLNNTISSMKSRFDTAEDELQKNTQKSHEDDQRISKIASENSTLREAIHRIQIEGMELKSSLENESVKGIREKLFMLKREHEKSKEIEMDLQKLLEMMELNETLKKRCEMMEYEIFSIEEEQMGVKSTIEIVKSSMEGTTEELLRPNFVSSVVLKNWETTRCHISAEMNRNNEILARIIEDLQEKRRENERIIIELNYYRSENKKLEIMKEKFDAEMKPCQ
ncbi:nucleoprotein TPR-like [Coccinella septempunctata]|uniref:nucleoprotein TPR-like n=1 Tax=Coccinella septempunctata TaxID=41139 RepID=UPI001D05DDD2|nr:nucleoprotein TPR-like [Coccinella septempunctata]